jgi:hypothetical protein
MGNDITRKGEGITNATVVTMARIVSSVTVVTVVTAVCLRPRFPPLYFPFPVAHVVCVFPGFLPSPVAAFLGPQQTFLLVICLSAVARDAVFFGSKIVGGDFLFRLGKFGVVWTVALHLLCSIGLYFGVIWSEGHRMYCSILIFAFAVCVCFPW